MHGYLTVIIKNNISLSFLAKLEKRFLHKRLII